MGSSANSSLGPQARAMAMMTRWRMPPDSWCGYSSKPPLGLGDADRAAAAAMAGSLGLVLAPCRGGSASDSVICWPIFMTGLSEVIGSWKTIAISVPHSVAQSSSASVDDVAALEADAARADRRCARAAGP